VTELVRCTRQEHLAWLQIQRPEVMNALSYETLGQLGEHVEALRADPSVRVVLVRGAGEAAFCAGADLKERAHFTERQTRDFVLRIGDTFAALAELPQPTIAVMNGVAFGGGLELALACDLRVASSSSRMGLTETALAIIPGAGGTQRLPRVIGPARARELILAARRVDAAEALRIGLVNAVAEPAALEACALELAGAIAANGPIAVRAAKEALGYMEGGASLAVNLVRERELYLERVLPSKDRLEALAAFKEKRPPKYRGV
jgi:enoyl-CoA hydratase/carnithine racemase